MILQISPLSILNVQKYSDKWLLSHCFLEKFASSNKMVMSFTIKYCDFEFEFELANTS